MRFSEARMTETVRRALLSVSDKTGLIPFASRLAALGIELVSTGGTAKALEAAGLPVTEVAAVTGFPEIMDGRVKTLHPMIHGGLLAVRSDSAHVAAMSEHAISPISLLVVNLYPFESTVERDASWQEAVENIDVGGPAMIRAAAKNHAFVTVVVDPADYERLIEELNDHKGSLSYAFRQYLMAKAFNHTADYDAMIAVAMDKALGQKSLRLNFSQGLGLRYGENSHQKAVFYRENGDKHTLADMNVLHGKELSCLADFCSLKWTISYWFA
jgi:phosphoribosylaminoimidazolecarboxamide formyltransferase/IMP cyclohydrolase